MVCSTNLFLHKSSHLHTSSTRWLILHIHGLIINCLDAGDPGHRKADQKPDQKPDQKVSEEYARENRGVFAGFHVMIKQFTEVGLDWSGGLCRILPASSVVVAFQCPLSFSSDNFVFLKQILFYNTYLNFDPCRCWEFLEWRTWCSRSSWQVSPSLDNIWKPIYWWGFESSPEQGLRVKDCIFYRLAACVAPVPKVAQGPQPSKDQHLSLAAYMQTLHLLFSSPCSLWSSRPKEWVPLKWDGPCLALASLPSWPRPAWSLQQSGSWGRAGLCTGVSGCFWVALYCCPMRMDFCSWWCPWCLNVCLVSWYQLWALPSSQR